MSKYVNQIVIAMAIAFLLGGVEMRVAVGRLEATVTALDKRVERIERDLDGQRTLAREE
jgi:hypothetical protein